MKIAILGTRGIPGRYGGFETFAQELSKYLTKFGHDVTVYGRHSIFSKKISASNYQGVTVRSAPTIFHKYLETPLASLFSILEVSSSKYDLILLCNAANSPFSWILRLKGLVVLINVDGIERRRSKWNTIGKLWYRLGELTSCLFGTGVIADAQTIKDYYQTTYGVLPTVITYGCQVVEHDLSALIEEFGLVKRSYFLFVSRFEPENNPLGVVEAYVKSGVQLPLVMVGDAPYAKQYKDRVLQAANSNVKFLGYQYGQAYQALQQNCFAYVQATEVGGTHPALVEAMGFGNLIVANGTPENLEVLGGAGLYYPRNDFEELGRVLKKIENNLELRDQYGEFASKRAKALYDWEKIAKDYERLFEKFLN